MSEQVSIPMPLHQAQAKAFVDSIADATTRELLRWALARLVMAQIRYTNESIDDFMRKQPAASVDLLFVVRALSEVFGSQDVLRKVLAGETVAHATGWDFDEPSKP